VTPTGTPWIATLEGHDGRGRGKKLGTTIRPGSQPAMFHFLPVTPESGWRDVKINGDTRLDIELDADLLDGRTATRCSVA
jgi:hypothetical protein